MNKKIIMGLVVVVIAAAAFFGGVFYQKNKTAKAATATSGQGQRQFGAGGGRFRGANGTGGFVGGQIIAKDDKSITVQLPNNTGSKIVFFSGSSQILKSASGSSSDLAVGQQVVVMGTTNSDGSVTAQNIQIRPMIQPGQGQAGQQTQGGQ